MVDCPDHTYYDVNTEQWLLLGRSAVVFPLQDEERGIIYKET